MDPQERTWDRFCDEQGAVLFDEQAADYTTIRTFYRVFVDHVHRITVYEERHQSPQAQGCAPCED